MKGSTIYECAKSHLGEDGNKFIKAYNEPSWGSSWAWCCCFVWYVFKECNASDLFYGGGKTAYVPTADDWMYKSCKWVSYDEAQEGDVVVFTWNPKGNGNTRSGSRDHIGFFGQRIDDTTFRSIEGNTHPDNGSGSKVCERTRKRANIFGIYRPQYAYSKYKGELPNLTTTTQKTKKLGHALCNERGGTHGGKKGDQSKGEVAITKWMYSKKSSSHLHWQYVARAKDKTKRATIADAMRKACKNDHIGYNIDARLTLMEEAKKVDFKLDKIKKNCDCDCSALVRVCCYCAGIKPANFKTGGELKALKATNAFEIKKYKDGMKLYVGDILWKPNAHTAILVEGGTVTETKALVKGDSRKSEVKKWQAFLNWYFNKKIFKCSGKFGDVTEKWQKKYQKSEGLTQTGKVGTTSLKHARKAVR